MIKFPHSLLNKFRSIAGSIPGIGNLIPSNSIPHGFPTPNGLLLAGDSRSANFGGISSGGGGYKFSGAFALTSCGFLRESIHSKLTLPFTFNYGVGSTTTYNQWSRMFSTNNTATGNPASGITGDASDQNWSVNNSSQYSLVGHPANVVFYMCSVNDPGFSTFYSDPKVTMKWTGLVLDSLRHKTVFLCNEYPRGTGTVYFESHAVAANTCTATNTAGFQDGSLLTLSDGVTNAGIAGVHRGDTGARLTLVASAPIAGQYTVTSGGIYVFADTFTPALLNYSFAGTTSAAYQITMHAWLSSNSANFTEPTSSGFHAKGFSYGIPGALYRRPWVVSVDSWSAIDDGSGTNTNRRGTLADSLHPTPYGGRLIAYNSFVNAFNSTFPQQCSQSQLPKSNNIEIANGSGVTTTYTVTLPPSMRNLPGQYKIVAGAVVGFDNGAGTISGTGFTGTNTINYSSGALTVTFSAAPSVNVPVYCITDQNNLCSDDPYCDTSILANVNATGTGVSGQVPHGWAASITNMGTCTAVLSNTTVIDDDDGLTYPCIKCVFAPAGGVVGSTPLLTLSNSSIVGAVAGTPYRAVCKVRIEPGADGHLYGLTGAGVRLQFQISPGIARPGGTSTTIYQSTSNIGDSTHSLMDIDLNGKTNITYESVTTSIDTSGMTFTGILIAGMAQVQASVPVSATVYFYKFAMRPVVGCSMEY